MRCRSQVPALEAHHGRDYKAKVSSLALALGCLRLGRALPSVAKEPFAGLAFRVQFPSRCECITGDLGGNRLIVL